MVPSLMSSPCHGSSWTRESLSRLPGEYTPQDPPTRNAHRPPDVERAQVPALEHARHRPRADREGSCGLNDGVCDPWNPVVYPLDHCSLPLETRGHTVNAGHPQGVDMQVAQVYGRTATRSDAVPAREQWDAPRAVDEESVH